MFHDNYKWVDPGLTPGRATGGRYCLLILRSTPGWPHGQTWVDLTFINYWWIDPMSKTWSMLIINGSNTGRATGGRYCLLNLRSTLGWLHGRPWGNLTFSNYWWFDPMSKTCFMLIMNGSTLGWPHRADQQRSSFVCWIKSRPRVDHVVDTRSTLHLAITDGLTSCQKHVPC